MPTTSKELNLSEWVNHYTNDLLSWASHKVSNIELAKDLVQDTFLAASEKIDSFRGDSSPKTWLFSILNYKIIDHYRAKMKKTSTFEEPPIIKAFTGDGEWLPDKRPSSWDLEEKNLLDDEDFKLIMDKCMDALPENWSMSLKLKYLTTKKAEEICQELDISTTNYWQIMHRAKLQLRDCIENNWFKDK